MLKFWRTEILILFLSWRLALFIVAFLAIYAIPQFGARFPYYEVLLQSTGLPAWIWGFGNFDGVHYLTIAQSGYSAQYTQAFFPLFPILVGILTPWKYYFETALILSNVFCILSLFLVYKLFRLDFDHKVSLNAVILLLVFPTAFYLGSIYTESLFLFLSVLSLYFARRQKFFISGLLASLASAARIFGIFLFFALAFELYQFYKSKKEKFFTLAMIKDCAGLIIAPLGFIGYMLYLKLTFDNPFYFLTSQPIFGAERTAGGIILLPQVIFRYIKMIVSVSPQNIAFYNAIIELVFTVGALLLLILVYRKIRTSYLLFTVGCLILPTLTGTLSSMPRYVLCAFLLLPFLVKLLGKFYISAVIVFAVLQAILLSLFIRGYWVA